MHTYTQMIYKNPGRRVRERTDDFGTTGYAAVARAFGLEAWRVIDPADLHGALQAALEDGRPTLVDVISQPLQDARAPVSERVACVP
jgi:acetolactate synthase-1/2/3 large subunit